MIQTMKMQSVSLLSFALLSLVSSYKMGDYITCWEQNMQDPEGFKDPEYYGDTCIHQEDGGCDLYAQEPNANNGDVCDHTDPKTGYIRNSCYFNVIFGPVVNVEKTWSYKCWDGSQCPLGDEVMGCKVQRKRVTCCCNHDDYCNGDDLLAKFAEYGLPANYPGDPPDLDALCNLDFGDWTVVFDVEGYEHCGSSQSVPAKEVHSDFLPQWNDVKTSSETVTSGASVADILLIFTYFVLGALCLAIGVCIGMKWKETLVLQHVAVEKMQQMESMDI
mmetsp:Transcript_59411/g.94498  ORF Transcript_59411/g.94498 Transcript_59411/m.94498 type:complete len:275 (-) Transcript_59411:186-1010(-)